ncbi:MAG: VIT domain-containing protein [Pseudomonadota bacterium]
MICSIRRVFTAMAVLLLSVVSASARHPAIPPAFTPIRLVQPADAGQPIRLDAVSVDAEVQGTQAITTIELQFFNPNARVLEGQLEFPLLEGQSVIGLAMDVNGKLREGVPVEKNKGRQVFEDVIRQRIDPALLEVTQGNHYKLRVYPIPANGNKRVVLKIADTLALREGQLLYRLPLGFARQLPHMQLTMRVFAASRTPVASGAVKDLVFTRRGEVHEAQIQRDRVNMQGVFEVRIPAPEKASLTTQWFGDTTYFQAEIPAPRMAPLPRRIAPRVALYWDASGSGARRDHAREFALLDHYFRAMGEGEVVLVRFRDRPDAPLHFKITRGDWRELKSALEKTDYDGATVYGALTPVAKAGEALLFSDGLNNFDGRVFPSLGMPVYAVASVTGADASALRLIAARSGGQYVDLLALPPTQAVLRVTHREITLVRLDGEGVRDVLAASHRAEQDRWLVAGVATEESAMLRATLQLPDGTTRTVTLPVVRTRPSKLAAYTWARLRLAELDGERRLHRGEIRRVGQAFRIPSPETSLIVLDRVEDYVQYNISPPEELKAEYERLQAQGMQARQRERAAHLENVVARFQDVQAWWNRAFSQGAPAKPKPAAIGAVREEEAAPGVMSTADRAERLRQNRVAGSVAAAPVMRMEAENAELKKDATRAGADTNAVITLKKWVSDAPYIARFQRSDANSLYRVYLDERPSWVNSSAFYLDAADALFDKGQTALALRVLSNLAEMNLENRHILRILGYRLMQAGQVKLAIQVFEQVRELAPDEPQSHRDLGLAYAENQQRQLAIDALYEVVSHPWHGRFPDVEMIALAEMNAVIARTGDKLDLSRIDPRLIKNLPLDLRVVLTWDADNTDIDLWVTDPNGEKAYYGNPLTHQGGAMSRDFTGGYGPEAFSLRRAKPGKYLVQAQFYGHRQQVVAGATTLQLKLTSGFGTRQQTEKTVTLRLKSQNELVTVGEFEVAPR